jgi:hypothetical protein
LATEQARPAVGGSSSFRREFVRRSARNNRVVESHSLKPEVEQRLHAALFDTSLKGIETTGSFYPLGGFLLIGAMVDMLAGLADAPAHDGDGQQGVRYAAFVERFFDAPYRTLDMGSRMWRGLRCRPLHNFSAQGILLADSQSDVGLHLHVHNGDVVLHWPEFLGDYKSALDNYWSALHDEPELQRNAECRCARYPPLMVTKIEIPGLRFPVTFPATFGRVASAYGGPPVTPDA